MKFISLTSLMAVLALSSILIANPFAADLISYSQGPGAPIGYNNAGTVLGAPPTQDSYGYAFDITAAPWEKTDIYSLGNGGHITIKFDHQIVNNSQNTEYGIDLLVFGNSFFGTDWEGDGSINDTSFEPAKIEVSQDGITFYEIAGVYADSLYPYTSFSNDFVHATPAGITYMGRQPGDVLADYAGNCGGAQVDISNAIGVNETLGWIQYVRITDVINDSGIADVVAFADVIPEPATLMIFAGGMIFLRRKK